MNILSIKLHRPAPLNKAISRPAIMQMLNEGLELGRPLTLISAPAGFGKTTCVSEWLSGVPFPVGWLSLDADDNDPGRFFTYLAAALKKTGERLGAEAFANMHEVETVLSSGQLPPVEVIAGALISDFASLGADSRRLLLVLDDFHLIQEPLILKVFERLITGLFQTSPPQPLHLVLLTREDPALPLARLRASNLLTEVRADNLRFNVEETARFLNDQMALYLSEQDVRVLEERTEGWIAGLQLAGLSIRGRSDPSTFIRNLSGSQRFILSYLTEEVLNRLSDPVQHFLLETAILERLSGELCAAVTGRADSPLLLEQLCSANLFLVPLDEDALTGVGMGWYRYHHLFADLLRSRQSAQPREHTAELHRRASRWFARSAAASATAVDERASLVSQAVHHALAAEDYADAVQLIETHVTEILNQWYAKTVSDWMQALPAEWSAQSPRANLAFARMHLFRGDFAQAFPYLQRLEALFSGAHSPSITPALRAEWLALQSNMSAAMGKPAEAVALARQALEIAPEQDASARGQIYLALATAYQQMEDIPAAVEAFQQVIQLGRASANIITELLGLSALSLMVIQRGQLHYGYELAAQGAARMERSGLVLPICAGIYGELGQVSFHWHQLDLAERYLQRAAKMSRMGSFSDAEIFFTVFRSRLALLRGDVDAAAREARQAAEQMRADAPVVVREEVVAQQVQVSLAQHQPAAAERILSQEFPGLPGGSALVSLEPAQSVPYTRGVLYLSALRILLYQARQTRAATTLTGAVALANRLRDLLLQRQYLPLALTALLLRAQLHALQGDTRASLADLSSALDIAEPEGYLSDFVMEGSAIADLLAQLLERSQPGSPRADFLHRILAACQSAGIPVQAPLPEPTSQAALPEPLTERELEVLRLVAEGKTYEEIAGQLVVSINTVRTHVKSIYGKLGANNRTAAIEAARQAKIL